MVLDDAATSSGKWRDCYQFRLLSSVLVLGTCGEKMLTFLRQEGEGGRTGGQAGGISVSAGVGLKQILSMLLESLFRKLMLFASRRETPDNFVAGGDTEKRDFL